MAATLDNRAELAKEKIGKLRELLRERKVMWGYPAAFIDRDTAVALLAGEITRAAACKAVLIAAPAHAGVRKWVEENEPTALAGMPPRDESRDVVNAPKEPKEPKKAPEPAPAPMAPAPAPVAADPMRDAQLVALKTLASGLGIDLDALSSMQQQLAALETTLAEKNAELVEAQQEAGDLNRRANDAESAAEKLREALEAAAAAPAPAAAPQTVGPDEKALDLDVNHYTDKLNMVRPDGLCAWGVDPDYNPSPATGDVYHYLDRGRPVFVVGPAGSGKTMGLQAWCKAHNRKMMIVSLNAHMPASDLYGESTLDIKGGVNVLRWAPGVVEIAMREGAVLILDEFDRAPYALQLSLNDVAANGRLSFTKGPYAGQTLYAREGFLLLGTGNTLKGSNAQYISNGVESSTLDRFKVLHLGYDTDAERKLMEKRGLDAKTLTFLQLAISKARTAFDQKQLDRPIGTRRVKELSIDIADGMQPLKAWEINIANMQHQDRTKNGIWEKAMEIGTEFLKGVN